VLTLNVKNLVETNSIFEDNAGKTELDFCKEAKEPEWSESKYEVLGWRSKFQKTQLYP